MPSRLRAPVTNRAATRPASEPTGAMARARPCPVLTYAALVAFLLIVDARVMHDVPPEGLTIGRDAGCGLVLDSPEVSRRHARVARDAAGFHITDESTNGVFVNGER